MPTECSPTAKRAKTWLGRLKGSSPTLNGAKLFDRTTRYPHDCQRAGELTNMPGKSNKFDYTNRSNSGPKLGQIIGTALEKEAEKAKKDAERLKQKARKQSSDSNSGGNDANSFTHTLDLKVPGKDLTDDGVCALVDGLERALSNGTSEASLALEDLNLSGNAITTRSLARLAPVIHLAVFDLKTLNLADNKIAVRSDEEAAQWETFLLSFKDCMKLRRLDLSGNTELGSRAMEVFARVHTSEQSINPISAYGATSTLSLITEHDDGQQADSFDGLTLSPESGAVLRGGMINGRMINRRCGLRSIPYITLSATGLDDAGALWLSYVLEDHYYPNQLIDELNATTSDTKITTYQQDAEFEGLDWTENTTLGKEGRQLLEKIEAFRRRTLMDDKIATAGSVLSDVDSVLEDSTGSRRASLEQDVLKPRAAGRRVSVRSIRTTDGGEHEATELESIRKKLKRYIIAHDKASSVELWNSALKIFRASRALLYISPTSRKHYTGLALFHIPKVHVFDPENQLIGYVPAKLQIDTTRANGYLSPDRASYASKLGGISPTGSDRTEVAITEVTNTPVTPIILQRPSHRKGAFSEDADYFQETTKNLSELQVGRDQSGWGPSALHCIKSQHERLTEAASEGRVFRDTSVPCNLPQDVVEYIMSFLMTDREIGVMNSEQRRGVLRRGQDRKTLTAESDWLKKDQSSQVLMLLDSVNCLTYQH